MPGRRAPAYCCQVQVSYRLAEDSLLSNWEKGRNSVQGWKEYVANKKSGLNFKRVIYEQNYFIFFFMAPFFSNISTIGLTHPTGH